MEDREEQFLCIRNNNTPQRPLGETNHSILLEQKINEINTEIESIYYQIKNITTKIDKILETMERITTA